MSEIPKPEASGFIKTLNNMGYMTSTLDPVSKAFIEFSKTASVAAQPALDIGAAYGVATLAAIQAGAHVIANDIHPEHLDLLSKQVPPRLRSQLTLLPGKFPFLSEIKPGSLSAILICRVLHFFSGPEIEASCAIMHGWLKPKGKVFIVVESPYLRNFSTFIPEFERRKRAGDPWPGFISNVKDIAPERAASLPQSMHFFDKDTLSQIFRRTGFEIEWCEMMARPDFPPDLQWDGRESVGLIGCPRN